MIGKLALLGAGSFAAGFMALQFLPAQTLGLASTVTGLAQQGWDMLSQNALALGAGGSVAGAAILAGVRSVISRVKERASIAVSTAQNQAFEFNQAAMAKISEANAAKEAAEQKLADLQAQVNRTSDLTAELERTQKELLEMRARYNSLCDVKAAQLNLPETKPTVA